MIRISENRNKLFISLINNENSILKLSKNMQVLESVRILGYELSVRMFKVQVSEQR